MSDAAVEHINITVADPQKTAETLCDLFGWSIRWRGDAIHGGHTIHVGSKDSYIAVYSQDGLTGQAENNYITPGSMNHIGIVVDDLDVVELRVRDAGFTPHSHADYEPGKRFYFHDADGIEFEVVSYKSQ